MSDLVDRYLACWNETDPAARRDLLTEYWAQDLSYVDPLVDVTGIDALDATIAAAQAQFPGWIFTSHGGADAHHDVVRFGWGLGPAGQEPHVLGFDVVQTGADGRIASVIGFLDRVPAGAG